ncbi:hypothetical protein QVD17_41436 [Tagetes erecta]|nr:hypothetical protein QVD17_41436 [Tagetes erecta]
MIPSIIGWRCGTQNAHVLQKLREEVRLLIANGIRLKLMVCVACDRVFLTNAWSVVVLYTSSLSTILQITVPITLSFSRSMNERGIIIFINLNKEYSNSRCYRCWLLIHHLIFPASTAELDKLTQFQDSVPLMCRAKRGCVTHRRRVLLRG